MRNSPLGSVGGFHQSLALDLGGWRVYAALVAEELPLIISVASLLVALGSAYISYMSLRTSGPNVKIRAVVSKDGDGFDLTLKFRIHNLGLAAVEVRQPYVLWLGGTFQITNEDLRSGATFPFALKPQHGGEWEASLQRPVLRRLHDSDTKDEFYGIGLMLLVMYFGVELGNGLTRSVNVKRAMRHYRWAARAYKHLNAESRAATESQGV